MKNLVIGNGQIGRAISKILECEAIDRNDLIPDSEVIHICFPYSENFVKFVRDYAGATRAQLIVIHSTLPIGTTEKIENAVYSPCRGVHPDLEAGIRIFDKYFAGEKAEEASTIFNEKGVTCMYQTNPRAIKSLEASKLWDTTQYGWNIVLEKMIYKYCQENGLDFDLVYTRWNQSYNEGYDKLGMPQYKKYVLEHRDGKIGGHCVIPNLELLDSPITAIIKGFNID